MSFQSGHTVPELEDLESAFTAGSVLFWDGSQVNEDNADLFWDDTLKKLSLGSALDQVALNIDGQTDITAEGFTVYGLLFDTSTTADTGAFEFPDSGSISIVHKASGDVIANSATTESGITADVRIESTMELLGFGQTCYAFRGFAKSSGEYNAGNGNLIGVFGSAAINTISPVVGASGTLNFIAGRFHNSGDIGTSGTTLKIGVDIDVIGTADNSYGIRITNVKDATANLGIRDESGANWALLGDDHRILFGESSDGGIWWENGLILAPDLVGSDIVKCGPTANKDMGLENLELHGVFKIDADLTTDVAPTDDTSAKKWSLQKLASAPTNAAYIAFTQNPGSDTFYLVMEEA